MTETALYPVTELLPHRGNLVLLDAVETFSERSLTASLQVRSAGILPGNPPEVPAWFGIEYMAQAIGAYAGMQAKQAGQAIRLGFLLGARNYHSNTPAFALGTWLTVRVEKLLEEDALSVFDCTITGDAIEVISKLNVYQPPVSNDE